jgi:hypothetical protein
MRSLVIVRATGKLHDVIPGMRKETIRDDRIDLLSVYSQSSRAISG